MAEMQIKIAADVGSAISGLNQVQSELDQTGKSAAALSNSVNQAANRIKSLPQSTGQASMAITNLNRVVQDAPFGFIGIQNNIGPLIDSFGMLKASTGSTGGAIRALAGSLIGPAGIGLAVAAVTSALTFAINGFSAWTKGMKGAKEANDKLAESLSMELVVLTSIVGLAQNSSASTADRQKALQLLNQEYSKYLPNLDQEAISLTNINDKYKQIIDSMMRQAVVKGLQEEIAKQVKETARQIVDLQIAREKERIELEKSNKSKTQTLSTDQKLAQIARDKNKAVVDGTLAFTKQTQAEKAAIGTTNVYDMMIQGLTDSLMNSLQPALKLVNAFSDLDKNLKKGKNLKIGKIKVDVPQITNIGVENIEIPPVTEEVIIPLQNVTVDFTNLKLSKDLASIRAKFEELGLQLPPINVQALIQNPEILDQFNEKINQTIQGMQNASQLVGQAITPAFNGLFKSIESGGDAIGGFFDGLAQGIKQLVQALLQTAAIAGLVSLITGTPFAANFKLISGLTLPGRANGGPVSGNNPYLVGERGPELFVPAVSGSIVPNNQAGSFMGGRMSGNGGSGGSILRGQDIILAYARTQRSQLRVNG